MKKLLTDRRGSVSVLFIGPLFCLLLTVFLVLEMGATYEQYDHCVDVLQRCCNGAVEANMDDRYRSDKILRLKTEGAKTDFYRFLASDLPEQYTVTITGISAVETPPAMTVTGTITFDTMFAQFGFDDLTCDFTVRATNYDLH